jgi:hypothetical protein
VQAAVNSVSDELRTMGVTTATCLTFPSNTVIVRHGFRVSEICDMFQPAWELCAMEPAPADMLELWRLDAFAHSVVHEPSRYRQFHIFSITGASSHSPLYTRSNGSGDPSEG